MIDRLFRKAGGDGASLTVPRPRHRIFKAVASDFILPNGQFATIHVIVMSKRRWVARGWFDLEPTMRVMAAGPVAVGYKLVIHPFGVPPVREGKPCVEEGGFI